MAEETTPAKFPKIWTPPPDSIGIIYARQKNAADLGSVEYMNEYGIDIRLAAHNLLRGTMFMAGLPEADYEAMMRPYHTGYWSKSDGMSSPVWSYKMCRPIFDTHDLDYFLGRPRKEADADMVRRMRYFPFSANQRFWVYFFVRGPLGWRAYRAHAKRRRLIPGYGTVEFIPKLPDYEPVVSRPRVPVPVEFEEIYAGARA